MIIMTKKKYECITNQTANKIINIVRSIDSECINIGYYSDNYEFKKKNDIHWEELFALLHDITIVNDSNFVCPNCGGTLLGDGRTTIIHCENVDIANLTVEPDSTPIFCT